MTGARSPNDYLTTLQALLPPGNLTRSPDAVLTQVLGVGAGELARVDLSATGLLAEADPRTTVALLAGWEADLGLPDPCVGPLAGVDARRAAVLARMTARGGASIAYFVGVATALGRTVDVVEFPPNTCEGSCETDIHGEDWAFTWRVQSGPVAVAVATCESACETALATWGDPLLECTIQRLAPAHTIVLFGYGSTTAQILPGPVVIFATCESDTETPLEMW